MRILRDRSEMGAEIGDEHPFMMLHIFTIQLALAHELEEDGPAGQLDAPHH